MNFESIDEPSLPEGTCSISASVYELKEIRIGIKSLKNNTSVGYDCISNAKC